MFVTCKEQGIIPATVCLSAHSWSLQVAIHFLHFKENKFASNKEIAPELATTRIHLWIRASIRLATTHKCID